MNGEYIGLEGRIQQTLVDLERVVERTKRVLRSAKQSGDDGFFDAVALNLHGFYAGVEHIFEDIACTVEGSIPSGSDWYRKLLLQMSSEANSLRPAVIQVETRHCLDEYRQFRHVVRNAYIFHLRPSQLQELTDELDNCFTTLKGDLAQFALFLTDLAQLDD